MVAELDLPGLGAADRAGGVAPGGRTMKVCSPSPSDRMIGIEPVRDVAKAWAAGEIGTREEAINQAVTAMIEARLSQIPRDVVERTSAEVARVAREDPALRERIGRLLDLMAAEKE